VDFLDDVWLDDADEEDREEDHPPSSAMTVNGSGSDLTVSATPMHLSMLNLLSGCDYQCSRGGAQVKDEALELTAIPLPGSLPKHAFETVAHVELKIRADWPSEVSSQDWYRGPK